MAPLIAATAVLAGSAPAAQEHGAGTLLRTVLVVAIVGAALLAWFLLRGYRGDGDADPAAGPASDPASGAREADGAEAERRGTTTESG
ncbi:hypothetical protein [Streptomyces sp. NPDC058045]|uniref:hypothetical protein n=1 Tax=Streptomyces sp. NPDC058045 TaxID=3346311 RepID=UPI0036EE9918